MIRAEHITKSFDGRVVLDDISIEFLTGKTNLIIGRSGSGKTVLLKTLVGLHEPDSGDVWYDDTNFTRLDFRERRAIRKDIGMIFQGGALLDSSTVEENVKLPLDLFTSQSEKEKMERVDFCLQRVRLEDANHLYPAELSGGMIKRVAIARAIVLNPRYLFCDEPNWPRPADLDRHRQPDPRNHARVQHHDDHQYARYELGHGDRRENCIHSRRSQVVGGYQGRYPACRQPGTQRFRIRLGDGQKGQAGCKVGSRVPKKI